MNIRVGIIRALPSSSYRYPDFSLTLYPFVCRIEAGHIILHEHSHILWVFPEALPELDWAAADVPVVQCYLACSGRDPL